MSANQFVLELIGKDKSLGKSFKGASKDAAGASREIQGFWNKMKAVEAILGRLAHGDFHNAWAWAKQAGLNWQNFGKVAAIAAALVVAAAVAIVGAAVAIGVKTVRYILSAIKAWTAYALTVEKFSAVTGMSLAVSSKFATQAQLLGTDLTQLAVRFRMLAKNVVGVYQSYATQSAKAKEAAAAGKSYTATLTKQQQAMKSLHVSITDGHDKLKSYALVQQQVIANLRAMKDGAAKTAIEMALVGAGRGGKDLTLFLGHQTKAQSALMGKAQTNLGLTVTAKDAKNAKDLAINMNLLRVIFKAIPLAVGKAFSPILSKYLPQLNAYFISKFPMLRAAINKFASDAAKAIPHALSWLKQNGPAIWGTIKDIAKGFVTTMGDISKVIPFASLLFRWLQKYHLVAPLLEPILTVFEQINHALASMAGPASTVWSWLVRIGRLTFGAIESAWYGISGAVSSVLGPLQSAWNIMSKIAHAPGAIASKVAHALGFASGGYVPPRPGGTPAIIGEGGQGEWVVPNDKLQAFARTVLAGSGPSTINLVVDGQVLASVVTRHQGQTARHKARTFGLAPV